MSPFCIVGGKNSEIHLSNSSPLNGASRQQETCMSSSKPLSLPVPLFPMHGGSPLMTKAVNSERALFRLRRRAARLVSCYWPPWGDGRRGESEKARFALWSRAWDVCLMTVMHSRPNKGWQLSLCRHRSRRGSARHVTLSTAGWYDCLPFLFPVLVWRRHVISLHKNLLVKSFVSSSSFEERKLAQSLCVKSSRILQHGSTDQTMIFAKVSKCWRKDLQFTSSL